MANEVEQPSVFVAGFSVEFLNGDESFLVTVFYKDTGGNPTGTPDKFSFSTGAKLKKFITKHLVSSGTEAVEEVAAEVEA